MSADTTAKFIMSMDDISLRYYLHRHTREISNLERRIQHLQVLVTEEMREADKRGLND